jgi:predicted nucleic acid-binding Zn ribbon protein
MAKYTTAVSIPGSVNKGKLTDVVKLPKFLRVCPVCALPFYTSLTTQVYCSRRCRNTAAVRRYRQRKKEARKDGRVPHVPR